MKGKNRKKKVALISALLALFAILAGTFAWTSYTEWVKNHMQSKGFEEGRVTIVEKFNPGPIDDTPEVTKEVSVVNTSSTDAFIRVSFEEMLHKLANGADGKGYATTALAKFPVIINDAEYRSSSYNDKTTDLVIKTSKTGTEVDAATLVQTGEELKLYVTPDGTKAVLVVEKPMDASAFPNDFDFEANNAKVPTIEGTFAGGDAVVAQKVTGYVEKQPNGKYEVYTGQFTGTDAIKNLLFWGYGVDKGTAAEADWAGAQVNVPTLNTATPPAEADKTHSAIDDQITFDMKNLVTSFTPGTAQPGKWYYDARSGYFYYLDVLSAGATTNGTLMDKIIFPNANTVDQTYKVASYNLYVGLESIPAAQSAIVATSTFGAFNGTPTTEGNKQWESNDSGWGLTSANDATLIAFYNSLATIVE